MGGVLLQEVSLYGRWNMPLYGRAPSLMVPLYGKCALMGSAPQ